MPRVPRLLSAVGPRSLNLDPTEAFLLSRIDALLDENELALVSGMSPAQAGAVLDRLARMGAIEIVEVGAPPPPPRPPGPAPGRITRPTPPSRAVAAYDPAELDEPADLEPDRKRRVIELYHRLDEISYYALLGVAPDADKKQVKSAYYAVAPEFHPDKYFRRNLGSFKQKIEAIFARITLAHDVLTASASRAEYDAYLAQTSKNKAISSVLDESPPDVSAVLAAVEQAALVSLSVPSSDGAPGPAGVPRGSSSGVSPSPSTPSKPPPAPTISPEEALRLRREALARKLVGGRTPPIRPSDPGLRAQAGSRAPTPPVRPASIPAMDAIQIARAAEALHQRHEAALAEAKRAQLLRYVEMGQAAMERDDYAGAANAYRIAASLAPDDPAVQATCNDALRRAASALADGYWKQAVYEEGQERWAEAALSYSKVCTGRPDNALAHERVAFVTLKMPSANARRAVDFARRAVEIDPRRADFHVTLARAYAAAGLDKSAGGELDRALELGQKDPKIKAMVASTRSALPKKEGK